MFMDEREAELQKSRALPWNTPPSSLGSSECHWCWRFIYAPALPCSVEVVEGLATMTTSSGLGDRCKWELATRTGDVAPLAHQPSVMTPL